jgi:hypothetical protein
MSKEGIKTPGEKQGAKEYSKPALVEYGRVEEITKSGTGSIFDLGATFFTP